MKRLNNIYDNICTIENLQTAELKARKGKAKQRGIQNFDKNKEANLIAIQQSLIDQTYKTSAYTTFIIKEPKERLIFRLPFKDRIVHHAIMLQLEPVFVAMFTKDTYSCIKGRGIHAAQKAVQLSLKSIPEYCLKLDITKFYPSIDHNILKTLLRRKFKDQRLLNLLDGIIDSAPGVPIGNYISQFLANLYLTGFDHWIKQTKQVKHYFRYADDIVILADDKPYLHQLLADIKDYLAHLKLQVKGNYQIFPINARGIDFVGYRFYPTHTLLRKSIKKAFIKAKKPQSLAAYKGWLKHCNARNLERTYFL